MSDFRSKVDRICSELAGETPCTVAPCPFGGEEQHSMSEAECAKCAADRICAALKERVEEMPHLLLKAEGLKENYKIDTILYNSGADEQFEACKTYLLKEGK
jgi:hypothetical protein